MDEQWIRRIVRQETRWLKWFYTALGVIVAISIMLQMTNSIKSFERLKEVEQVTKEFMETNQLVRQYYLHLQNQDDSLE